MTRSWSRPDDCGYRTPGTSGRVWKRIAGLPDARHRWPRRQCVGDGRLVLAATGDFYDQGEASAARLARRGRGPLLEFWNPSLCSSSRWTRTPPLPRRRSTPGWARAHTAILQGAQHYDIDLFRALILASAEASGVAADGEHAVSHRDCRPSACLGVSDRRRRAAEREDAAMCCAGSCDGRCATRRPRLREPLVWRLVPAGAADGCGLPELLRAQPLITETLRLEETNFKQTSIAVCACSKKRPPGSVPPTRCPAIVSALRHLWLSTDLTEDAARTRPQSGDRRLRESDGTAARGGAQELDRLG